MKPYFETANGKLYHGDCLEIMPELEPVDLVLTDPPYVGLQGGLGHWGYGGVGKNKREYSRVGDPWKANFDWLRPAWNTTNYGMMVFCSYHNASEIVDTLKDAKKVALACWFKRNAPPSIRNVPRHTVEYVWYLHKATGIKWGRLETHYDIPKLPTGCMAPKERLLDDTGGALHPSQKPMQLILNLAAASEADHTILDPFIGTGTTATACERLSRAWIGIEISEEYCEIAAKRIEAETRQLKLF